LTISYRNLYIYRVVELPSAKSQQLIWRHRDIKTKMTGIAETANGVLLNAEEIFNSAARKARFEKYADTGMRQRFSGLIECFNQNGPIADRARPAAIAQIEELICRRLELARDWVLYPEIETECIERPILILGNGRTGTTVMQCLLALDEGCRAPLSWECRHPSPPPGLDPQSDAARIALENEFMIELINISPGLLLSHPYVDAGAFMETEDEDIIALDFHQAYPFHFNKVPVLPIVFHNKVSGLGDALRFHKKVLQQLQWKTPTKRWVCKSTGHQYQGTAMWDVYPDALCVWTHRDPVVFLSSVLGICAHVYTPVTGVSLYDQAHEIANAMAAGYNQVANADWVDDSRLVHVRFEDFIQDQVGTIRKIYERGGLAFSENYETKIRSWLSNPGHKSDRHGKFKYSLEQFGLDPADIKKKFACYYDRFLS